MVSRSITISFATCLLTASAYASAADMEKPAWYIGAGIGHAQNQITDITFPAGSDQLDNSVGYKLFAGYQFNDNWATELEYVELGKFKNDSTYLHSSARASGVGISAVGMLPLPKEFSVFGKLGAFTKISKVEEYTTSRDESYYQQSVSLNPLLGIGAQYHFTPNITIRAEYEYFGKTGIGENDAKLSNDLLSVSMRYSF